MTSVDDAVCSASYGVNANLISGGGSGMVGWVQQFSKYICTHIFHEKHIFCIL